LNLVGFNSIENLVVSDDFCVHVPVVIIPTVSALNFDTHDLFYNIRDDLNRLDRTPFDEIFGMDFENESHVEEQASQANLVDWLVDQIDGNHPTACLNDLTQVGYFGTGSNIDTVSSGQSRAVSNATEIESQNYHINSGATVSFIANNSITLLPGFHSKNGSSFTASLEPYSGKACSWTPYHTNPTQSLQFVVERIQNPSCSNACVSLVARVIGSNGNYGFEWYQDDDVIGCDPPTACSSLTFLGESKYVNVCFDNDNNPNTTREFRVKAFEVMPDNSRNYLAELYRDGDLNCGGQFRITSEENLSLTDTIQEKSSLIQTSVFPNPSNEIFRIETNNILVEVIVSDASGKLIKTQKMNRSTELVNMNNYKTGIYFLNLLYENGEKEIIRIIKK